MRILARFTIKTAVISILKTDEGVEVEIRGAQSPEQIAAAKKYVIEEGFLDKFLPTGLNPHQI